MLRLFTRVLHRFDLIFNRALDVRIRVGRVVSPFEEDLGSFRTEGFGPVIQGLPIVSIVVPFLV